MKRPRIRFIAAARREFYGIGHEYDAVSASVGDDFGVAIDTALQTILDFPESGSPHLHGTRKFVLAQFPYSLVYRFKDGEIVVVAVAHHRQEQAYWKGRRG